MLYRVVQLTTANSNPILILLWLGKKWDSRICCVVDYHSDQEYKDHFNDQEHKDHVNDQEYKEFQ